MAFSSTPQGFGSATAPSSINSPCRTAIPSLRTGCRPPRRTRGVSLYSRERRRRGKQLPVDLLALMNSLYDRRQMAVVVPYEPTSMKSDSPREDECHNNADRYVLENPDCKSIRGWLVFDNATALVFRSRPHFRFTSHSVVERADGRLSDPTPTQASQRYPFLRHRQPTFLAATIWMTVRSAVTRCGTGGLLRLSRSLAPMISGVTLRSEPCSKMANGNWAMTEVEALTIWISDQVREGPHDEGGFGRRRHDCKLALQCGRQGCGSSSSAVRRRRWHRWRRSRRGRAGWKFPQPHL